ncbi:branched-chain amino acid ABC transporter permease [Chelatococcus reniformis]|uniref:Branched-chain amino acid ABC transporter permease n=1 Tax=Chelatococcus reniformis TaxID=1494448 RepID=A0A916UV79_9HYPH|nr:branched-chain amino acid ABC transporter permease [Chelatococcus reniformis]GGC89304.1 branched-chain amino acid ABC transporter permease [Chelatococcus reniformis]
MNVAQQLVNGLVIGSGFACVALGWTILLGAARLVNFAHGQMYMLAAFICWFALTRWGLDFTAAAVVAVLAMGVLGILMQSAMSQLVVSQNLTSLMIVTLGFGYMIQGAAGLGFGGSPHALASPADKVQYQIGGIWFTGQDLIIVTVTLALYAGVWLLLNRTRQGAMVRAIAEDPKLAQIFGINTWLVYVAVFMLEAVLVAIAAVLVAPKTPILTSMGFEEVIMTFVVVVLGGVGNVGGALVAGLALGIFTAFFGALVSPAYTTAASFAVLLAFLTLRPEGFSFR